MATTLEKTEAKKLRAPRESIFLKRGFREGLDGYLFIAPFIIGIIVFFFYMFISGFYLAFTDAQGINPGKFIGIANFQQIFTELFTGGDFWKSLRVTLIYEIGCLITQIPVAFVLAFVLNSLPYKRLQSLLRASFFMPVLINTVIVAWLFRQIFNPDQGVVNWLLGVFGYHTRIDWLQDTTISPFLVIIVSFWQWTGFHMVYFVSQLQTIDPNLYEAAKIDGANPAQILTRITLPLMRPAVAFVMITSAVGGLLVFDIIYVIFPGASTGYFGTGDCVKTLVPYIYKVGFMENFKLGYAAAAGWVTFLIIMLFSLLQIRVIGLGSSREEE